MTEFVQLHRLCEPIDALARVIHENARAKGFWDDARSDAECIALMHSELSEMLESCRNGHPPDHHCPHHANTTIEAADCIIRILDFCAARNLPIGAAIEAKHNYNLTRPRKHGKAF